MRKITVLLLSIFVLAGCNSDSSFSFSEVKKENLNGEIQSFFQGVKEENGVHLYMDNQKGDLFAYFNGSNVIQGEKATTFTGFDVEGLNNTLNINYESEETSDYANTSKDYELFYKVNINKVPDEIRLFHNGEESFFGTISGN